MGRTFVILWVGELRCTPGVASQLKRHGFHVVCTTGPETALHELRAASADLIVLEQESCLRGELVAVKFKSAAPKVPVLLLCDPQEPGAPQVFFVNMILSAHASTDILLRAIESLLPSREQEETGT